LLIQPFISSISAGCCVNTLPLFTFSETLPIAPDYHILTAPGIAPAQFVNGQVNSIIACLSAYLQLIFYGPAQSITVTLIGCAVSILN
jgi:hypothetical protein